MTRQPDDGEARPKLVRVATTGDRREAEAWFHALRESGIPARVASRAGDAEAGGAPRLIVYVREEDRERARAVLSTGPRAEAPVTAVASPVLGPDEAGTPAPAWNEVAAPAAQEPDGLTLAAMSGWLGLAFLIASVVLVILSVR